MIDKPAPVVRKPGLLGVCAAIGDDFGFNPEYLRAPLVLAMLWNATYVIGAYLAVGAVVALSRWLVPSRRHATRRAALPAVAPQTEAERFEYAQAA